MFCSSLQVTVDCQYVQLCNVAESSVQEVKFVTENFVLDFDICGLII